MAESLSDKSAAQQACKIGCIPATYAGAKPKDDPRVKAIGQASKELVEQRDRWLNAESLSDADKKKRTLTNLYNVRPTWLDLAHKHLDEAVFAAYGWNNPDLSDKVSSIAKKEIL